MGKTNLQKYMLLIFLYPIFNLVVIISYVMFILTFNWLWLSLLILSIIGIIFIMIAQWILSLKIWRKG